jgi:hypothetical protein
MSNLLKTIWSVITPGFVPEQTSQSETILKGVYIMAHNDCGEVRVIHDPHDLSVMKSDRICDNKHDLNILRLKCEDLLSFFKRRIIPERGRDLDYVMQDKLYGLIDEVYLEIDDTKDISYDYLVTRYEACKIYARGSRNSYRDLNALKL